MTNNKKRVKFLKIPLSTKQETKNCLFDSIGTKEAKKCIKKEKKMNIENIFIKKQNKNIKKK